MTVNISDIIAPVLVDIPKCLPTTAIAKMREVARDFCDLTRIWKVELAGITPVEDQRDYPLSAIIPVGSRVAGIIRVSQASLPLNPLTAPALVTTKGNLQSHYFPGKDSISFWPIPSDAATELIYVTVALKPTRTATTLDDDLVEDWAEALINGTKGELFAMPNKTWTDPSQANYHKGLYLDKRGEARVAALKGGSPASHYVNQVEFGF